MEDRDADKTHTQPDGLRRRRSTQHDAESVTDDGVRTARRNPPPQADDRSRRSAPDLSLSYIDASSAVGPNSQPGHADSRSHIRFSSDLEHPHATDFSLEQNSRRNVPLKTTSLQDGSSTNPRRPGTPNLSVDTSGASQIRERSSPRSPLSLRSPASPDAGAVSPPGLPGSPLGRNRGFSLRRSMFSTRLGENYDGTTSPIEMSEPGPSNGAAVLTTDRTSASSKKGDEAFVTVTSLKDFKQPLPSSTKPSALKGASVLPNYEKWLQEKTQHNRLFLKAKTTYGKARKFVLRINEIPPSKDGRHIDTDAGEKANLLDERTNKPFIGNTIHSARYNAWNFVPRQLWAQFSKLANFYFLCISILQLIPGLSTTGTYTTIVPLLFFVSISIAKEGYDDLRRTRLDKEENNRNAQVFRTNKETTNLNDRRGDNFTALDWQLIKWKDVKVGDIVKLERDEAAPADIVLLHSTGENGVAYIETMALDGETNLKSKQALPAIQERCDGVEKLAEFQAQFVVEDPNLDLYNFEGRFTTEDRTLPLSNGDVIYRGSILRNTPEATGLVIYSGEECKIRMNANKNPRIKAPSLQTIVNRIVVIVVLFVLALSIFNTVAYQIWSNNFEDQTWYLTSADVAFGPIIVSFIIMFNTMIPLSLYVSLEIVKVCQMLLLNDIDMYDERSNTPLEARTSTINEELGQVSYIFSDKTGTLTDNCMKFRKISVAGSAWLHNVDLKTEAEQHQGSHTLLHKKRSKGKKPLKDIGTNEASELRRRSTGFTSTPAVEANPLSPSWGSTARPHKPQPEFDTTAMLQYIQRKPFTVFAKRARFFLLCIALCHTCLPEPKEDGSISFQAASPDELALVEAAKEIGYVVTDRQAKLLKIKTYPHGFDAKPLIDCYEILDVIEFSSKRKRMSVVVRLPDERVCVISKGADSTMMQLLRLKTIAMQKISEIEQRVGARKSMEAEMAMKRKLSEQVDGRISISSPTFPRMSMGALSLARGEPSNGTTRRKQSIRDQVDTWLTEREQDVDVANSDNGSAYYTPRQSGFFGRRSHALSDALSLQDHNDEDVVDEALAADDIAVMERCFQHINDFATEGLRTLMYGYRFMDQEEYVSWKKTYHAATTSLVDRQDMIERAGDLIEKDLELAGATAIEDKLQRGVPEAIDKLRRANIKMWMLTGDKRETAINIGHSCRLIKDYSSVTVVDHENGVVGQSVASAVLDISNGAVAHSVVVIDGQTLTMIEADTSLYPLFLDLAIVADSVICCRASPSQKAGLVKAIRHKVNKSVTLAIGDGANDIAMIQEAHVGIGITGKEGLQAARVSDYSIAQFRFLTKLLLVHGHWNYIRTCKYTVATFWKEMAFYLTQALYQRYAGYTGTSYYESWSLSMFNTLFTSLPVIFLGIFEKDLLPATLIAVPELYTKGQRNGGFNYYIYLWWMFVASAEAMILFFVTLSLFAPSASADRVGDIFPMSDLTYTAVVIMISIKLLGIEMHNLTIVNAVGAFLSVGGWFLWNIVLAASYHNNTIYDVKGGFLFRFGNDASWWTTLILLVISIFVLEITFKTVKAAFKPSDTDVFQQLEKDLPTRMRFEEAAATELQKGWDRGKKKSSFELEEEAAEEARRQAEVAELLKNRGDGSETIEVTDGARDTMERLRNRRQHIDSANFGREAASMDVRRATSELSPLEVKRSRSLSDLVTSLPPER